MSPSSPSQPWKRFTAAYEAFAKSQKKSLDQLMRRSDKMLGPKFCDPLRSNLMMQSILSEAREESYSAALAWSFSLLSIGHVLDILGIRGLNLRGRHWRESKDWTYESEVCVPEGHEGRGGRVDLAIWFQHDLVAVIEIKTNDYLEYDTAKHRGYCKWVLSQAKRFQPQMIFIAVKDLEFELHGLRFVSWSDITAGLRRCAPDVIKNRTYTEAAVYLACIGALEQNLLGFGPPHDITDDVAVLQADHLQTVLDKHLIINRKAI